ncbi:MAG TPA: methylmalonyl-CoA mutase family protein [Candidatus Krumholzibacteria bacterium]|nr:methylmalonyl-CoA mutase family protein [Candidatus Krumholzibacteria bacterium]
MAKTNDGLDAARRHKAAVESAKTRTADFTTLSGERVDSLYTPSDIADVDYERDLGVPGEYPFTRGPYPNMYRGRMWTMRQFSGFGTAHESNQRYKYLLSQGGTGLSVAFDLPTLMGLDPDDERAEGEVGRCGVSIASLRDMETLFDGIDLGSISTSMTINGPAAIIWAFYIAAAEKQGTQRQKLRGTLQNDILKEYIAQKEFIYPPSPSMRLVVDTIEFATREMPLFHPVSISGYHIREAGSTAVQELAFTLADGFGYVEASLARGLDIDEFAPRLSFFFNAHSDFFEEICKYRAARRIWARHMREHYGAKHENSWRLRFHTQTAGCSLTAQQPENNIVRVALQALSGVLGGTQSLHTNAMDETLALPTDKAAKIALRTQQVIAHETGVTNVVDPLGGSYFVEAMTTRMEQQAEEYFRKIEGLGGVVAATEAGFQQREIGRAAYRYQKELEARQKIMVGVNECIEPEEDVAIPLLKIDMSTERHCRAAVADVRRGRDSKRVERCLRELKDAARGETNLMPTLLECAHAYVTVGEAAAAMVDVFGAYREPAVF